LRCSIKETRNATTAIKVTYQKKAVSIPIDFSDNATYSAEPPNIALATAYDRPTPNARTWAPALLLLARLFQGLSVGGEYGTSATYMSEVAVEGRKGFYASFQYVTLIGGQLLALLVVVVLQHTMEDAALREWGWRIPFALGAVLAVVALWLRRQLDETSQQETRALKEAERELSSRFGIRSIPTIMIFKNGQVVDMLNGAVPKAPFDSWLNESL
jgi:MFS family permease